MAVIGMDLGGTKLSAAIIDHEGAILTMTSSPLAGISGRETGKLITDTLKDMLSVSGKKGISISGAGICVPGIYYSSSGEVWAPNIPGWEQYPLRDEIAASMKETPLDVRIDSDRACYILGETWTGAAKNSKNAIFLAVGTGIGAGILCDGRIIRGHGDIAGAAGWMSLTPVFRKEYTSCGCFEYHASGSGLVKVARANDPAGNIKAAPEVFNAYSNDDPAAVKTIDEAITFWGMASANLISIFNPEAIIFGGGVFGPASAFLDRIRQEAIRWAQPVSMKQVRFETSILGGNSGLIGAGRLAIMKER